MKKIVELTVFLLAMLSLAAAQQSGGMPGKSGGYGNPPSSQIPATNQSQAPTQGSAGQDAAQPGAQPGPQGQAANEPITEGCLGGSNPNFTITDSAGTTYKLNFPPNTDPSSLTPHVGESVQVMGDVKQAGKPASIDVSKIGRGTGNCPSSSSSGAQPPPK
jgi:hypothetical protein